MAAYQITAFLPHDNAIQRDAAQNVTHWDYGTGGSSADLTYIIGKVIAFYNGAVTQTEPLGGYISPAVDRDSCYIEARELTPATGILSPVLTSVPFTLVAMNSAGLTGFPAEVALVSTIWCTGSGANTSSIRRRRGRIYLGPLNSDAADAVSGQPNVPAVALISDLATATETLATQGAAGDPVLCVYSRSGGETNVVDRGWVDNAWDSQRRRGEDPTARTSWSA